jgi:CBS domain-containing protein
MKVQDVMTSDVGFCSPTDSLVKVAAIMRQIDCGAVPIVNAENRVVGIITERDAFLAVAGKNLTAAKIEAGEFCTENIVVCKPDDKIKVVLRKMRKNQIKRLPVISQSGELIGIISITDVLLVPKKDKSLRKKAVSTLTAISKPRPITLREI